MDWLAAWGVANAIGFLFKEILIRLARLGFEDYVKDFFKGTIRGLVDLAREKPLQVAFGQALKEFLALVQQELEDADVSDLEVHKYLEPLDKLIRQPEVLGLLGLPFQAALTTAEASQTVEMSSRLLEIWSQIDLPPLPEAFNWDRLSRRYSKKVESILRESATLRDTLDSQNLAKIQASLQQLTPVAPVFDLSRYQKGLEAAYSRLKLDSLDTSGWEYKLKLWNVYVPQSVCFWDDGCRGDVTLSVLDLLNDEEHYRYTVVLGDPGSGKSTLVQSKAINWARNPPSSLPLLELPILIELRNYLKNRQEGMARNFLEYLSQGTGVNGGLFPQAELHQWLQARRTLVMFDGLDEILNDESRENITIDIINFSHTYPQVRILITSRLIGYAPQRFMDAGFGHFQLLPLSNEQIQSFLHQWHRIAFEDQYQAEARRVRLQHAIDTSSAFRELAGNPLLLTMMAILNRHEALPRDRATLYEHASEVLLQRWEAGKNLPEDQPIDPAIRTIDYKDKQEMLRRIAHRIQEQAGGLRGNLLIQRDDLREILAQCLETIGFEEPKLIARTFMEQLVSRSFLLCFMGKDSYGFVHRTFLEYFCAWHYVEQYERRRQLTPEQLEVEIFGKHWSDPSWHEVLSLIIGMIDAKFAGAIIDYLIEQTDDTGHANHLLLAAKCLSDVRHPKQIQASMSRLLNALQQALVQGSLSDALRSQVVVAIQTHWKEDQATIAWLGVAE